MSSKFKCSNESVLSRKRRRGIKELYAIRKYYSIQNFLSKSTGPRMESEEESLAAFDLDSFLAQRATDVPNNDTRGEGRSGPDVGTLVPIRSTEPEWLQAIKEINFKRQIMHDIIDTRNDDLHNQCIRSLQQARREEGLIIVADHHLPNFRHIHIIHDCNYNCSRCRCAFLSGLPMHIALNAYNSNCARGIHSFVGSE